MQRASSRLPRMLGWLVVVLVPVALTLVERLAEPPRQAVTVLADGVVAREQEKLDRYREQREKLRERLRLLTG